MKMLDRYLPACLTFGPVFMVMTGSSGSVFGYIVAISGALIVAIGGAGLYLRTERLTAELEKLKSSAGGVQEKA